MKTNWSTKKLSDLLEICDAGVWGKPAVKGKGLFVLRSTNMTNDGNLDFSDVAERNIKGDINKLKLLNGDILVEKSGGGPDQPVGRVAYFTAPNDRVYAFANFIQRLRTKPDLINGRFLFYYLLFLHKIGFTKRLQSQTTGIRNLKLSLYLKTEIPFFPLKIQKQIVERLDKIAEAQKSNENLIQKADELFQSLLHKELNPAGKGWKVKKIRDVAVVKNGGTPNTKNSKYWNGKVLWLTPKELSGIEDMEVFDTERKISDEGLKHSSATLLPAGTVLLTSRAPIGYITIAGVPMATNQGFKNFICNKKLLDNKFLYFFLRLKIKYLQSLGRGATFTEISKTTVEKLDIPIPPLKIQKQIVAKLSAAQDYKKQLLTQKARLKELFDSVLHKSMNHQRPH